MSFFEATILGLVQGLTEFIPVSSTGHLILAHQYFNFQGANDLAIDAVLQLATAFAVIVYFRGEILEFLQDKFMIKAIIIGSIPAVILGLLLEDWMATVFRSSTLVAWMLIAGAALMFVAERFSKEDKRLTTSKSFVIGLFQSLALIPGMSRSGSTISGGLITGLSRIEAVKFSFILSIPILIGSGLKKLLDLYQTGTLSTIGTPLLFGSLVAFVSGLLAIHFLINYLKGNKLTLFIVYRVIMAAIIIFFI